MKREEKVSIKAVGVFCGSSAGGRDIYAQAAARLGELLVQKGITMVYGGGNIGLMGVIADTMLAGGGEVIGVIPEQLTGKELAHRGVIDMRVVDGMNSRKKLIYELSDAFIAMPGGYGTMDELFEMLTQFQLGISEKPCGILNVSDYYTPLVQQLDLFQQERFLRKEHREHLLVSDMPEQLLDKLEAALTAEREGQQWIDELKINNRY